MNKLDLLVEYKKYRWFFTSSDKLVIGGKNSLQNDLLLKSVKQHDKDFIVLHTSSPGSPFSVILSPISDVNSQDIEECAIFTASFSKAWKSGKKKALVDVFSSSQLYKIKSMKEGTWGVKGKIKRIPVNLALVLTTQKGILRAVPPLTISNKKKIHLTIVPGSIDKKDISTKIQLELNKDLKEEELLSALPAGGIKIIK